MSGLDRSRTTVPRTPTRTWLRAFALIAVGALTLTGLAQDKLKPLVQQAFEFHQRGDFSAALPLLRRAYAVQPGDYFVNLLLGIDSLRSGDAQGSIPFLKKASSLRPKEEFPLGYLAEAYARQGLFSEAAAAYIKAVKVAPGSSDSAIAFVDFALARYADISSSLRSSTKGLAVEYRLRALAVASNDSTRVSLLQRAADLDPTSPDIWSQLALAALKSRDSTAAAEDCRRALQAEPNDLAAWIVDAQLAAQASDWKRVNRRLNAVAQRSPLTLSYEAARWPRQILPPESVVRNSARKFFDCVRDAETNCQIASWSAPAMSRAQLFAEQRWDALTRVPPPAPGDRTGWLQRGIGFAQLHECATAIPALERGSQKDEISFYALFQLSLCYSEEAGRTAQKVQESAEYAASLHVMRGDILLRLQAKPDLASEEYQQALAHNPNDPGVLDRLAEAQFAAGKTNAARATAEAALKIDPQREGAKRTLAKIAIQNRDYTTALPYLRELAARNPGDVTGKVELGKACAQTGAFDEARQYLAPALADGYPDEKGALHYLLGNVLKKMGRTAQAERAFAEAAQLSDSFQHKSYRDQDPDAQP